MPAMRRVPAIVMLILAVTVVSAPARAEMTYQQYENLYLTKQFKIMNLYLGGLFEAISWTATSYEDSPGRLFCLPGEISLKEMQSMISEELATRSDFYAQNPNVPMTQVAFDAIRRRYPCKT